MTCCLWFDTKPVHFISTEADPTIVCAALCRIGAQYKRISQPSIASKYAEWYKSIDFFDSVANKYSIWRCSYRPWRYLFGFCLQSAIINAYVLYISTSNLPRPKKFCQSDFRILLDKQLIGSYTVCKYQAKIDPIFVGPDNPGIRMKTHESTRMPSSRGKVCRMHKTHFGKVQQTVYGCLVCNVHLCKSCHIKWHYNV